MNCEEVFVKPGSAYEQMLGKYTLGEIVEMTSDLYDIAREGGTDAQALQDIATKASGTIVEVARKTETRAEGLALIGSVAANLAMTLLGNIHETIAMAELEDALR